MGWSGCRGTTTLDKDMVQKEDDAVPAPDTRQGGLCEGDDAETLRPAHWIEASHCDGVPADYERLFDDQIVHRIDITVAPSLYQETMDDLDDLLTGGGPGAGEDEEVGDPMWVEVTLDYDGLTWEHVGMRYKGNSSLRASWQMGVRKLSFRLNFEKYEADYPGIEDQRFFGFRKMTFSNGFKDSSLIRDKLAADIFRDGGAVAARGAFARVYVDSGDGPAYFGLYTMIEDPSNKLLDSQFTDDSGNLYKPEGDGASWETFVEADFEKKTNEDEADFSDIIAVLDALHGDRSDAVPWREDLDAVFKVEEFLRVLAINQVMVNWDSYGCRTHNYYLYGDPDDDGRLHWFPWDLNEALLDGGQKDCNSTSVMLDEIGDEWPLIRYLLDDSVYRAIYREELLLALEGAFALEPVTTRMKAHHALIAPYVVGPEGEAMPYTFLSSDEEFEDSLTDGDDALVPHLTLRHQMVSAALGL